MADDPIAKIEEWRTVPGFSGYEASSLGRVRSIERWITRSDGHRGLWPGRVLRPTKQGPYLKVALGKRTTIAVHIVVCLTFHGPRPSPKHAVAHWDGDCHNNRAENLRWATVSENKSDMIRHGTTPTGSKNPLAKLSEADVRAIRKQRAEGVMIKDIATRFDIHWVNVSRIVHRKIWKHLP